MRIQIQAARLAVGLVMFFLAVAPAFSKHTRQLVIDKAAKINGNLLTPGQYNISWETHSPEATVTITHKKNVVATTNGTVVVRPKAYDYDSIVYFPEPDGSLTIIEVRFAGSKNVLTFENSAPSA
jgi:hypothetical protein